MLHHLQFNETYTGVKPVDYAGIKGLPMQAVHSAGA
jgi:hypothetical protein